MKESDWQRSQARQMMIDHLKNGSPLPDVMIDSVLNIFLARVGSCLLTRAEIMMQGEHAQDERKEQCRYAYKLIQRAMKEHAQRIGMGRHAATTTHGTGPIEIDGNRSSGVSSKRDRKDDRRSGLNFENDSKDVTRVSHVRDEERTTHAPTRNVSTRTRERRDHPAPRKTDRSPGKQRRESVLKSKRKRSTVTPSKRTKR